MTNALNDADGSWLVAIARNMGEALGKKAGDMVELSNMMNEGHFDSNGNVIAVASDLPKEQQEVQDKNDATQMSKLTAQFQAEGQEYSILNNAFTNTLKSLGEANSNMAKKQ